MDPGVGRFASVDPWAGDLQTPFSLHRYLYANASPVVWLDPSGEISIADVVMTGAIFGILSVVNATIAKAGVERWGAVEWEGFLMGATGSGLTGGGFLMSLESEEIDGKKTTVLYVIAVAGIDVGPLPVSVTGAPITVETPRIFGLNGWIFGGLFGIVSASSAWGVGISGTAFSVGVGIGWFSPGVLFGIDIGLMGMGGVSIPVYVSTN